MISELPWIKQDTSNGFGDLINQKYSCILGNEEGEFIARDVNSENAEYIVNACNMLPKIIEVLKNAQSSLYEIDWLTGQNLEVANWHKNDALEPLDNFIVDAGVPEVLEEINNLLEVLNGK